MLLITFLQTGTSGWEGGSVGGSAGGRAGGRLGGTALLKGPAAVQQEIAMSHQLSHSIM